MKRSTHIERLALAVPEQRRELGISRRELAACAEVSEATIERLERGVKVRPGNVVRVALAMAALDLYAAPHTSSNVAELRVAS